MRHFPYYLLNLASLRSRLTKRTALPATARLTEIIDFECEADGAWQRLPDALVEQINADRLDAIVKFGLGLLRVPEQLKAPILSYHHGDPRKFRGRPAGFYELLAGEPVIGQVVQIIGNRLDAGAIVAFAETPAHRDSYRRTMREAYGVSPLLLRQALDAVAAGTTLDFQPNGKAYRLPGPWTVARFAGQRLWAGIGRLAYGAFIEKAWQVGQASLQFDEKRLLSRFPKIADWQIVARPRGIRFLADPFPNPEGAGILVEAMRSSSGLGEIMVIDADGSRPLLHSEAHYSYPATIDTGSGCFLVPEICQWSTPKLYRLEGENAVELGALRMSRPARLVDPTLFERDGIVFMFANDYAEGDFVLRLWHAPAIDGEFCEHPRSPVLISPRGGRMGGLLIQRDRLYRIGQDGGAGYGDGIVLFRIDALTRATYRETMVDQLRFTEVRGPHTLNFSGDRALFDFYRHRLAPLAGLRRLRNRIASRRKN